jgi:hypothetical protein
LTTGLKDAAMAEKEVKGFRIEVPGWPLVCMILGGALHAGVMINKVDQVVVATQGIGPIREELAAMKESVQTNSRDIQDLKVRTLAIERRID